MVELKLEDVKEQKIEPSEPSNVMSMERMYENTHIQDEVDKLMKVRDNGATPAKLRSMLQDCIPKIDLINQRNNPKQVHDKLHNEILLFKQDVNAMQVELKTFKEKLIAQLSKVINNDDSQGQQHSAQGAGAAAGDGQQVNELHMYGSNRTDVCMHWSNIDLMVKCSPSQAAANLANVNNLHPLNWLFPLLEKEQGKSQWMSNLRLEKRYYKLTIVFSCSLKQFMIQNEVEYPENLKYEALYDRTIDVNIVDYAENHKDNIEWAHLTQQYTEECWILEPFLYVIKQLLNVNQMNC